MSIYIKQIKTAFQQAAESDFLVIKGSKETGYSFSASPHYDDAVAIRTLKLFKEIFHDYSVQEILEQAPGTKLTKATLQQVFVKMAVFSDKGPPLDFKSLNELEDLFLVEAPQESHFRCDKAKTSGKDFEGLCEKVYLQWHHYFTVQTEKDPIKTEIREAEFLASRMADREFQEGAYVYLAQDKIYQVDKTVARDGAYVSILKNVDHPEKVKIVCRGTAMRRSATEGYNSGINDIQYEIGNGGVQAVWGEVAKYLETEKVQSVEMYGKSLGGAHAQRLAVLIMQYSAAQLTHLCTVCSVGVGPEAEELFKEIVEKDSRYNNLKLTVIRNGGDSQDEGADYIPCLGGEHLGATLDEKYLDMSVHYIHPTAHKPVAIDENANFFQKSAHFVSSFSDAHLRQSTLTTFSYDSLASREEMQLALKSGLALEGARRILAYKNQVSFTDFVATQMPTDPTLAERVALIVSTIFFVLFAAAFIGCLIAHPGAILYQGHGITLTVEAVAMAAGAGASFLAIAISTCCLFLAARLV